jgi:2'-5' RNA ligase
MTRTGIAIVWPAWFPGSTDPELHCTALFLGDTESTTFSRDLIERVVASDSVMPGECRVTGQALFGREQNVPVLTIASRVLMIAQEWMTRELEMFGIYSPSEFGFSPHVTVAKESEIWKLPAYVHLQAPVLWWGDERALHTKHAHALMDAQP